MPISPDWPTSPDWPISTGQGCAVGVEAGRVRTVPGLLRALPLRAPAGCHRFGLVATTALLLGGDEVHLDVTVGAGMHVELRDIAGTVAYDGDGRSARWDVQVRVEEGGSLTWAAEPFVVADGADVERTLRVEADPAARVVLRETLVLGRHQQVGGRLRSRTTVAVGGRDVLVEDQLFEPGGARDLPGVLRGDRVLDSVLALGPQEPGELSALVGTAEFRLPYGAGRMVRYLGADLARSPLRDVLR